DPAAAAAGSGDSEASEGSDDAERSTRETDEWRPGTVNVVVGTTRALDNAGLATLLSVAVEAKTATLLAETGFPGTTTDAVVAACDPAGEPATFAGSGTSVGAAARACVRDALRESLRSRYAETALPESVEAAEYGVTTDRTAETFEP
ncbi:adenosylcobinamide amidohydrolase, partial [Halorussus sp. GCM10023401]